MDRHVLDTIAGVLFIAGFAPYILAIFGRDLRLQRIEPTSPQKTSWLIWGGLDGITLVGMILKGSVNGQIIGAVIGAAIVVILAFIFGKPGWSPVEKIVLASAVMGVVAGFAFSEPNVTILISSVVLVVGSIPTFSAAWKNPGQENKSAWTLYWLSCVVAMFAIPAWTIEDAAQVVAFTVIETVMMFILYVRPRIK